MSEAEDTRVVADSNDNQKVIDEQSSGRSSSLDNLDGHVDDPKETTEQAEKDEEKGGNLAEEKLEAKKSPVEPVKKEINQAACSITGTEVSVVDGKRRDERGTRVGATGAADGSNETAAVGEWNSLPVLVDRLRAALELASVAPGGRRDDEPAPIPEDSGIDSEEDLRIRNSMEQVLRANEPDLKKDLKFLEDLLLSDIQTALSRLRETLERIDVNALARHGAASDPSGKLNLLRLVSSLLSRLQVPEAATTSTTNQERIALPVLPSTSLSRRRRGTRHTIGVSAEELASARKWLEEERNGETASEATSTTLKDDVTGNGVPTADRRPDEVRDKYTKDAINQRQSLKDKNKDPWENRENRENRLSHNVPADVSAAGTRGDEKTMHQTRYRPPENCHQEDRDESDNQEVEEQSRVSKLAAALRQRAELSAGRFAGNKFTAKKSKIKRANTIDIPSYLKLQAESLGHEGAGCVSLRRPINVGDRAAFNAVNVIVPSFQPKTENDRKFLALINKNNEAPLANPVAPFKTLGQPKPTDLSSLTNENWNSRFSNIKTTFDKPSHEDGENKATPARSRVNKRFVGVNHQTHIQSTADESSNNYGSPFVRVDSNTGFRHAPSSPFRKIEKSPVIMPPTKVPPTYHWSRNNNPAPTSTLREKARMMFDRDGQPSKADVDSLEKPSFPRPPWLDHERNDGAKANGTVTENGRLDYRSFCKQFAPFVGKGAPGDARGYEEPRQRDNVQRGKVAGVVDGKISLKMIPEKRAQVHQYPVEKREVKQLPRERFGVHGRNAFELPAGGRGRGLGGTGSAKTSVVDATLRGSSSVAVQTGVNDEHPDEGRSFRVAAKISKGPPLICTNASVQTGDPGKDTAMTVSDVETGGQWKPCFDHRDSNRVAESTYRPNDLHRFVLDHNQNYHAVSSDPGANDVGVSARSDRRAPNDQGYPENGPFRPIQTYQKHAAASGKREPRLNVEEIQRHADQEAQNYTTQFAPSKLADQDHLDETMDGNFQGNTGDWATEGSGFLDDQNIQNQDISPDIGVVTRYTCAIATVASSVDSPEPRSEEVAADSRASSSPSPSQWSWSRSRPPTSETVTPEEEIRRHNMLQQSLVRRLQNETTSLNDQPHLPGSLSPNLGISEHKSFSPSFPDPKRHSPNPMFSDVKSYAQTPSYPDPKRLSPGFIEPKSFNPSFPDPKRHSPNPIFSETKSYAQTPSFPEPKHQSPAFIEPKSFGGSASYNQPANFSQPTFHQPGHVSRPVFQHTNYTQPTSSNESSTFNRSAKFLAPVVQKRLDPTPVPISANRVGALRDAYEQVPNHPKSISKERSPIPNGVTPNDSSDEYLVSCATKPSRSIVLSKSESWHQLALSNSHPGSTRVQVSTAASSSSRPSSHPKPPKPRSPSSQKLRSKQYEASSMADSVKKMEDKIRRYFDSPGEVVETKETTTTTTTVARSRRSPRAAKGLVGLSRSRTMPGVCDDNLRLVIPPTPQMPLLNVNTADVDKVFDDLFEEATRTDGQC